MLSSYHTVPSDKLLKRFQFIPSSAALLSAVLDAFARSFRCSFNCRLRYFERIASSSVAANFQCFNSRLSAVLPRRNSKFTESEP